MGRADTRNSSNNSSPSRRGGKKKSKGRMNYLQRQRREPRGDGNDIQDGPGPSAPPEKPAPKVDQFGQLYGDYQPVDYAAKERQKQQWRGNNGRGGGNGGGYGQGHRGGGHWRESGGYGQGQRGGNWGGNGGYNQQRGGWNSGYYHGGGGYGQGRGGYQSWGDRSGGGGMGYRQKRRENLSAGMKGFLCTTGQHEKYCVRDAYNILNDFYDNGGAGDASVSKVEAETKRKTENETKKHAKPEDETKKDMKPEDETKKNVNPEDTPIMDSTPPDTAEAPMILAPCLEFVKVEEKKDADDSSQAETVPQALDSKTDNEESIKKVIEIESDDTQDKKDDKEEQEMDIDDELAKEINELKSERSVRKFQSVNTGVNNVCFISTTIDDPNNLAYRIFEHVKTNKATITRNILRFLPIQLTCNANNLEESKDQIKELIQNNFKDGYVRYQITYSSRYNGKTNRDQMIGDVAALVGQVRPLSVVNLNDPEITIVLEVMKSVLCIAIVKDFGRFKKYNLSEAWKPDAEPKQKSTKSSSGEAKGKSGDDKLKSKPDPEASTKTEGEVAPEPSAKQAKKKRKGKWRSKNQDRSSQTDEASERKVSREDASTSTNDESSVSSPETTENASQTETMNVDASVGTALEDGDPVKAQENSHEVIMEQQEEMGLGEDEKQDEKSDVIMKTNEEDSAASEDAIAADQADKKEKPKKTEETAEEKPESETPETGKIEQQEEMDLGEVAKESQKADEIKKTTEEGSERAIGIDQADDQEKPKKTEEIAEETPETGKLEQQEEMDLGENEKQGDDKIDVLKKTTEEDAATSEGAIAIDQADDKEKPKTEEIAEEKPGSAATEVDEVST